MDENLNLIETVSEGFPSYFITISTDIFVEKLREAFAMQNRLKIFQ